MGFSLGIRFSIVRPGSDGSPATLVRQVLAVKGSLLASIVLKSGMISAGIRQLCRDAFPVIEWLLVLQEITCL
ncbi:hypothetical protein AC628_39205 [Bradyrhizobium sp. NAS96.2]|nr:hypothetical protein AC628_39205 [Bradyrhizobium sp. NAS96.2]